jgi:hypothetical protein
MQQSILQAAAEPNALVERYLERVGENLLEVPAGERARLLEFARARIELDLELEHTVGSGTEAAHAVLARLGDPAGFAQRLRSEAPPVTLQGEPVLEGRLTACRACRKEVSVEAVTCPHCGAPYPARQTWRGWGYEWKSERTLFGYPLVHVAFGRDANGKMRVATGIIAVGQFAKGAFVLAQFGIAAVVGIGQFVIAPIAVGQLAFGLIAIGQLGIGILAGIGMVATGLWAKGMAVLKLFGK